MGTLFKQLETKFQRTLNEYKSVYEDYMVELKHQNGEYWNTKENVTVSNESEKSKIPFITYPNITKEKCLHSCASDSNCKYVLFSDSGNGECAANRCLKWTKSAGGFVSAPTSSKDYEINVGSSSSSTKTVTLPDTNIKVKPIPTNAQFPSGNTFSVEVNGNQLTVKRTDKKSGWGFDLQLKGTKGIHQGFAIKNKACGHGEGPTETSYTYSGWEKPTWDDSSNISFMGDPKNIDSSKWKSIGNAGNLAACKEMSVNSSNGPFSSVVFVENDSKCYGSVPHGTSFEKMNMDGVYSSIPPLGSTNVGGITMIQYIKKLNIMNNTLKDLLYKMNVEIKKIEKKDSGNKEILQQTQSNIQVDFSKLKNDKTKLQEMEDTLNTLETKLGGNLDIISIQKLMYMGTLFAMVALFAFYSKKKLSS